MIKRKKYKIGNDFMTSPLHSSFSLLLGYRVESIVSCCGIGLHNTARVVATARKLRND